VRDERLLAWYCGSVAAFWILASQSPFNFLDWVFGSMQTVCAYGDAMSSTGNAECSDIVMFGVLAVMLLGALRKASSNNLQFLAFSVVLFTSFKHGFIRHDGHELTTSMAMVLIALCVIALCWKGKQYKL